MNKTETKENNKNDTLKIGYMLGKRNAEFDCPTTSGTTNPTYTIQEQQEMYDRIKNVGKKYDQDKLDWSLLPWEALEDVIKVLMNGAKKYDRDNWKRVPDAPRRYINAAQRHITAIEKGEEVDSEFGLDHEAHAICCLLFRLFLKKHPQDKLIDL